MVAAERMLDEARASVGDWTVAEITDAGTRVGYVAVVVAAVFGPGFGVAQQAGQLLSGSRR
ncbi:hypothetical protein [Streptomyces sp. NBC_01589]|uniref:hypothetical protein n=1 Tax=unclassified Streptomyces TaxID=2593676 RepID=UPI003864922E